MDRLEQAFLKLEETQEKLISCNESNIKLMEQANKDMKEVVQALDGYYENKKPSLLKRFKNRFLI